MDAGDPDATEGSIILANPLSSLLFRKKIESIKWSKKDKTNQTI